MSIITICANLTETSSTKTVSELVHQKVLKLDSEASFISLHDYPIPICDGRESFSDQFVQALNERLASATGFVLATPVYNYSINSTLKSLIEHCGSVFKNKPVGFICTAGGEKSYMSIMPTINSMMLDFRCIILPRFLYVTSANFNSDKTISDPNILNRITQFSEEMTHLTKCLEAMPTT